MVLTNIVQQVAELNDKIKEAEQMKANKFREAVILDRKRFPSILSHFYLFPFLCDSIDMPPLWDYGIHY